MIIDYLANNQQYIEELAGYWCKEWGANDSAEAVAKKSLGLKALANVGEIPFLFIALEGNVLIGSGGIFTHDLNKRPELTPWLAGIFVKQEFRGQKVATKLVKRIEEEACSLGVERLFLHTENAAGLYKKLGWEYLDESENDRGIPCKIYQKDLKC